MVGHTHIRRVMVGWGASVVAETGALVALLVIAYEAGGPAMVALLAAVRALPVVIIGPVVIGRSDRGRREVWLVGSLSVRAALLGGSAALLLMDVPVAALILGGSASLLFSTHRPLNAALLPQLARTPAELTSANAGMAMAESGGALLGPVLAGVGLVAGSPVVVLAGAALLVVAAAVSAAGVKTSGTPQAAAEALTPRSAARDLGSGFRALSRPPMVLALVAGQTFARGVLLVAVVVLAKEAFASGDSGVAWLTAMLGLGGLAGAAIAAVKVTASQLARAFVLGVVLWGLPMMVLGAWTTEPLGYLAFAVIGLGNAVLDVGVFTLVARLVGREQLGRAFAAFEVLIVVCVTLGSWAASALLTQVDVGVLLAGVGGLLVVAALAFSVQAVAVDGSLTPHPHAVVLRDCSALGGLPLVTVEHLADASEMRTFSAGAVVVREGDLGTEFFVIASGRAGVDVAGEPVGELGPGDGFGEIALLRHSPRTATVTARTPMTTLVVSQRDFVAFVAGHSASAVSLTQLADARTESNSRLLGDTS